MFMLSPYIINGLLENLSGYLSFPNLYSSPTVLQRQEISISYCLDSLNYELWRHVNLNSHRTISLRNECKPELLITQSANYSTKLAEFWLYSTGLSNLMIQWVILPILIYFIWMLTGICHLDCLDSNSQNSPSIILGIPFQSPADTVHFPGTRPTLLHLHASITFASCLSLTILRESRFIHWGFSFLFATRVLFLHSSQIMCLVSVHSSSGAVSNAVLYMDLKLIRHVI